MIAFFGDLSNQQNPPNLNIEFGQRLSVLNLEGPIESDSLSAGNYSPKAGPRLKNSQNFLKGFKRESTNWVFSLANNHIFDFGYMGLSSTFDSLSSIGIGYCGAGISSEEATKALDIDVDGVGITFISCADQGFGYSGHNHSGFALNGNWVQLQIVAATEQKRIPIVLYHGGVEDFSLPSPSTKDLFESWADFGAKLVIGTHSHVPQPIVKYRESIICYGLGNFLVDPSDWPEMSEVNLSSLCLLFNPVDMCFSIQQLRCGLNDFGTIEVKSKQFTEELNNRLEVAAEIMGDKNLHSAVWQEMCVEIKSLWLRKHFLFSFINEIAPPAFQRLPYIGKFFRIPFALDSIAWSVHREMLITLSELKNHIRPDERTLKSSEYWSVIKGKCD
jgi:hypothetical protein